MKHKYLWRSILGCYLLNCVIAAAFSQLNAAPCAILSAATLLLMQFIIYRRALLIGSEASQMRDMVEHLAETDPARIGELDAVLVRNIFSPARGRNSALLVAAAVLALNAAYMLPVLLQANQNAAFDALRLLVRFDTLPAYAVLRPWLSFTGEIGGAHAFILLLLPVAYPVCGWLGYLRGHQNWCKSRQKMQESAAKGPRKIVKKVKKYKNLSQTPEI